MKASEFAKAKTEFDGGLYITDNTEIVNATPAILDLFSCYELRRSDTTVAFYKRICFSKEFSPALMKEASAKFAIPSLTNAEDHIVLARGEEIYVHANTDRGLLYGAASLLHLSEGGYVKNLCFYNSPICQERGIKLFIPSKRNVPFFKKFVNMLVFYKFNTIMIEVGGRWNTNGIRKSIKNGWRIAGRCRNIPEKRRLYRTKPFHGIKTPFIWKMATAAI